MENAGTNTVKMLVKMLVKYMSNNCIPSFSLKPIENACKNASENAGENNGMLTFPLF